MPRDVDEKKTRKALRKLRKAKERAEADGIELTDWEKDFVDGVDERLTKYGSAFADPHLGAPDEALSNAQSEILRQLDKKSRGKTSNGLTARKPLKARKGMGRPAPNVRRIDDDIDTAPEGNPLAETERKVPSPSAVPDLKVIKPDAGGSGPVSVNAGRSTRQKPVFQIIEGGKSDS